MKDYVTNLRDFAYAKKEANKILVHFALFVDSDLVTFEDASHDKKSKKK